MRDRGWLAAGVEFVKRLTRSGEPVRHVLVEPSDYVIRNVGDMSMLEVALTRLATMWPHKQILVLSDTPDVFPRYRPNIVPLTSDGRRAWLAGSSDALASEFTRVVATADLLLVAGMGGITDAFPEYAMGVLATLQLAHTNRVPTAMMGQGMGPLEPGELYTRAAEVLPNVNRIALREERAGRPLLLALGVSADRIVTTGDDAIETAYARRRHALGNALGINARAATYSGVGASEIETIREGITRFAGGRELVFVPVPISRVPGEEDAATVRTILRDLDPTSDGGSAVGDARRAIDQIAGCRVVVTGSYHAGVFALAMGIPVVGLASSQYYIDKFLGLADQFPSGCEVVSLRESGAAGALASAIDRLWVVADDRRATLLAAAASQIAASRAAYAGLESLVRHS
jgi:colanic acid/amylovoran biosynthesis protein